MGKNDESTTKAKKPKPAKTYMTKAKIEEAQAEMDDITSSVKPLHPPIVAHADSEEADEADVFIPECQPNSVLPDMTQANQELEEFSDVMLGNVSFKEFGTLLETTLITTLNNREEAQRKACEEWVKKQEAEGKKVLTQTDAINQCASYMSSIQRDYNMYKRHEGAIDKVQKEVKEYVKQNANTCVRLETIIGRVENVQGVKAPKRPPFPSWACLAYLLWHWPMYAFSYLWLSKYFRRFCFLIAFLVMVLEFCLIVLLASENGTLHHDRVKYVTVRNWSYVAGDTAAVNRFNEVDILFEDTKFNREKIEQLNDHIRSKHEQMLQQKQKQKRK